MTKRALIHAYTQLNLGDDLLISIMCKRYPETKFYIRSNSSSSIALKKIPNLKVIPYVRLIDRILNLLHIKLSINNLISRYISFLSDCIIHIGGSIFIEQIDWKNRLKLYKERVVKNKPYCIIGCNFGPYKDRNFYEGYKNIFKMTTDICFRDTYSYDLFSELPNARFASDIVFLYPQNINGLPQKQIIISVIDLSKRKDLKQYEKSYQKKIINISRRFYQEGYSVILMSFCKNEGDEYAISQIMNQLNVRDKEHIINYFYTGDIEAAVDIMQKSKYIISTRFHSMILGWVLGKPVYPIIYSNKSLNVINDVGFKGKYTMLQDIDKINEDEIYDELIRSMTINIDKQVYSANLQFKMLDKILN